MNVWSRRMNFISITCGSRFAAHRVQITDKTKGFSFWVKLELTDKEIEVVLNGGQLRTLKKQLEAEKEA